MKERLVEIARAENCSDHEQSLIDHILVLADGDMRRAVTTLQSVHALALGGNGDDVDQATIAEIVGLPPNSVVDALWESLATNKQFRIMQSAVDNVVASGYSAQLLLAGLLLKIMDDERLDELHKADLAIRVAQAEKNMTEGADEHLQLLTVTSLALKCFQTV
jgi:replication factor C subunit 2/4